MPLYDYICTKGCPKWESLEKLYAKPLKKCPHCGKSTAKRMFSNCNFILKGKGFYKPSRQEIE